MPLTDFTRGRGTGSAVASIIKSFLEASSGPLGDLTRAIEKTINDASNSIEQFKAQIEDLVDFEFNPKWKTRVISVPFVIDNLQDLRDSLIEDFKTAISDLEHKFNDLKNFTTNVPDPGDPGTGIAFANAFNWVIYMIKVVEAIGPALQSLLDITQIIDTLKHAVEDLDPLFLTQSNPRSYKEKKVYTRKP